MNLTNTNNSRFALFKRFGGYIKNAGLYLSASLLSSLLSVLINPLMAINLSKTDYAIIGYYQGFANFFTPFIGFFILDYFLKSFYRVNEEERKSLRATVIKLYLSFTLIVVVLCLIALFFYSQITYSTIPFMPYAPLFLTTIGISFLCSLLLAECRIQGKAKKFAAITIISGLISISMSLLFVVCLKMGATGKLLGALLSSLLLFLFALWHYRSDLKIKFDRTIIKPWIKFATPLVLAGVLGFFTDGYDRVFLERKVSIETLGIYSVGFQMAAYLSVFANSIKATFQPDVFKSIADKNVKKLVRVNLLTIGIIAIVVFLFIIACPLLISILTAGRYTNSTPFARILALSIITSNFYFLVSQATFASGLSHITLINKIIGAAITIPLLSLLIGYFGAVGAAWGVVLSYLFSGITNLVLLYFNKRQFSN